MKKNLTKAIFFSLACALFAACANNQDPLFEQTVTDTVIGEQIAVTATAGIGTNDANTRLSLTDDAANSLVKIAWKDAGEAFSVLQGNESVTPVKFEQEEGSANGKNATFTGSLTAGTPATCYAVYPALADGSGAQKATEVALDMTGQTIGLDEAATYMYASQEYDGAAETVDFKFEHLTAIVKLTMTFPTEVGGTVSGIRFAGTNLYSSATVDLTDGTVTAGDTQEDFELSGTVDTDNSMATVYLHVLPATLQQFKVWATVGNVKYEGTIADEAVAEAGNVYVVEAAMTKAVLDAADIDADAIARAVQPDGTLVVTGTPESSDFTAINANSSVKIVDLSGANFTELPVQAFCYNTNLKKNVLPEGLESISNFAFYGCTALVELNVPSTVKTLGASILYGSAVTSFPIPAGVTEIPASCFYGSALTSMTIPATVTSFGVGEYDDYMNDYFGFNLANCDKLESLVIETTQITNIPMNFCMATFDWDDANAKPVNSQSVLKKLVLPEGVTKVGCEAFRMCPIEELTLPSTLKEVWDDAFGGCKITELVLPEGFTTLKGGAFRDAPLKKLDLPSTIEELKTGSHVYLFNGSELEQVICRRTTPGDLHRINSAISGKNNRIYNRLFCDVELPEYNSGTEEYEPSYVNETCILYVPDASVAAYQQSDWALYFKTIQGISTLSE